MQQQKPREGLSSFIIKYFCAAIGRLPRWDRIHKQTQGYVVPDAWTHGSSEQRLAALQDGLQSGDVETCNTPGWIQ